LLNGDIKNWKEIGGADQPVVVVRQTKTDARETFFKKRVMKEKDFPAGSKILPTAEEIFQFAAKTQGAIGFLNEDAVNVRKDVSLPNTPVIGRPIFIATVGRPSEKLQKFEAYLKAKK
jgi:phosphate transport system substrate-binding protein